LVAYHPEKFSARASFSKKNLSSDGHFERPFSFMAMKAKLQNHEKQTEKFKHYQKPHASRSATRVSDFHYRPCASLFD
jgi:hypothetical protein